MRAVVGCDVVSLLAVVMVVLRQYMPIDDRHRRHLEDSVVVVLVRMSNRCRSGCQVVGRVNSCTLAARVCDHWPVVVDLPQTSVSYICCCVEVLLSAAENKATLCNWILNKWVFV